MTKRESGHGASESSVDQHRGDAACCNKHKHREAAGGRWTATIASASSPSPTWRRRQHQPATPPRTRRAACAPPPPPVSVLTRGIARAERLIDAGVDLRGGRHRARPLAARAGSTRSSAGQEAVELCAASSPAMWPPPMATAALIDAGADGGQGRYRPRLHLHHPRGGGRRRAAARGHHVECGRGRPESGLISP
jgi:hypothetical protein